MVLYHCRKESKETADGVQGPIRRFFSSKRTWRRRRRIENVGLMITYLSFLLLLLTRLFGGFGSVQFPRKLSTSRRRIANARRPSSAHTGGLGDLLVPLPNGTSDNWASIWVGSAQEGARGSGDDRPCSRLIWQWTLNVNLPELGLYVYTQEVPDDTVAYTVCLYSSLTRAWLYAYTRMTEKRSCKMAVCHWFLFHPSKLCQLGYDE